MIRSMGYNDTVRYVLVVEVPVVAFDTDEAVDKADTILDKMIENADVEVEEVKRVLEWVEQGDEALDITEDD